MLAPLPLIATHKREPRQHLDLVYMEESKSSSAQWLAKLKMTSLGRSTRNPDLFDIKTASRKVTHANVLYSNACALQKRGQAPRKLRLF